jgi:glucose-6-phosphate-specific signal transduction histidine kinase
LLQLAERLGFVAAVDPAISNPVTPTGNGQLPGRGHGVQGMRERADLLGGSLEVRRDDGCFRLSARLPYAVSQAEASR